MTRTRRLLQWVVGVAAIVAPALHSLTDAMEWHQGGFTDTQLMLNLAAFLPMPWLLLGMCAVYRLRPGNAGYAGALLYGTAFAYFVYTTAYALAEQVPTYDALWQRLGRAYTWFGGLMVVGGALFAASILRTGWLPRYAALLFGAGIAANFVLALLPAPAILQTLGSAVRNVGLIAMGCAMLADARRAAA